MLRFCIFRILICVLVFYSVAIYPEPEIIVITGGPCTGKTTLINALASKGYCVVEEAAGYVIKESQKNGIDKPWLNLEKFQLDIVDKQTDFLNSVSAYAYHSNVKFMFLDRSYTDGLAYFKINNVTPPDKITSLATSIRYAHVFVLDFVDVYLTNKIRRENRVEAEQIHRILIEVYTNQGYKVITVPAVSVEERVKFVLSFLQCD